MQIASAFIYYKTLEEKAHCSPQSKLDALKRHQAETAADLDALLPAVLERAFRGEL